ncbi:hypothetical protein GCM10007857_78540 [Bradyrhizobium iriomotense]|uniref:Uncharacterized protein n=2 Tax=Bradyrhizobium iriomotense TaxID=441950 RepID=A0ABQ6BAP9_9BRAD|nr:hypothetical protein GCM10007857_78540 [Bradyrhizobium iriomotense]
MSPLVAITRWLESQDLDMQLEIAGFATFLMFGDDDVLSLGESGRLEFLHRWLNEPDLVSPGGRALTFQMHFDWFVEDRMSDDGWKRTEDLMRKNLNEAKRDRKFAAARKAQRMLDLLPARKECWNHVLKSWNALTATYLTHEALTSWTAAETRRA